MWATQSGRSPQELRVQIALNINVCLDKAEAKIGSVCFLSIEFELKTIGKSMGCSLSFQDAHRDARPRRTQREHGRRLSHFFFRDLHAKQATAALPFNTRGRQTVLMKIEQGGFKAELFSTVSKLSELGIQLFLFSLCSRVTLGFQMDFSILVHISAAFRFLRL